MAAHPGIANTNIVHHFDHLRVIKILRFLFEGLVPPTSIGVLPIIRAAVGPDVQGGAFYGPGGYLWQRRNPKEVKPAKKALDVSIAGKLWEVSARLTGVKFL